MEQTDIERLGQRLRAVLAGRFEIGELVGAGGYAAVFRARDPVLGRDVAIKVLDPARVPGANADRLLEEARVVATIEHPHIVPLYEAGHEQGVAYLVMRFFPEGSLARRFERERQLPPADVARIGLGVAEALASAHQRELVHLDIKPDNILLDAEGHAAVTDFGIAQVIGTQGTEGTASGTPHYMSPEHVAGDVVDGRADVYALGVVLYEAAAGRPPITGTSTRQVMANQVGQAPPPLASLAPDLPTALADVITRALAKDPADRWPSAAAMAAALRSAGDADRLLAPQEVRRRARRRRARRTIALTAVFGLGLVLAIALAVGVWRMLNSGDRPAIDVMAPRIPVAILDSATALGLLAAGDTAVYVFAPAGGGVADALVVTTRDLVIIEADTVRRRPIDRDYNFLFKLSNRDGFVIVTDAETKAVDTLYRTLSGREQGTLRDALTRLIPGAP